MLTWKISNTGYFFLTDTIYIYNDIADNLKPNGTKNLS